MRQSGGVADEWPGESNWHPHLAGRLPSNVRASNEAQEQKAWTKEEDNERERQSNVEG
jgi:hypothetical protein